MGASSAFKADPAYPYETPYAQVEIEVPVVRLEDWWKEFEKDLKIDLLCMDLQGAELRALKGMGDLLHQVDFIITEVQYRPLYFDSPVLDEVREFLLQYQFKGRRVLDNNKWFGDVLFEKCRDVL
jgi:hypothetical protein